MLRLMFVAGMCLALGVALCAAPVPNTPADPTKDRDGNPLPKGATARLGSRAFPGDWLGDLAFSSDGKKLLAIPSAERVLMWDAETGKPLPAQELKWGDAIAGERAVTCALAGERTIWVTQPVNKNEPDRTDPKATSTAYSFKVADGSEVARARFTGSAEFDVLPRHIYTAALSADGKYLAVAPEQSKTVEVFDMETGKRLHTQKFDGDVYVYVSPDSKTLYVLDHKKPLRRFELVSGKELPAVPVAVADAGAENSIHLIAASPDGKRLGTLESVTRKDKKGKATFEAILTVYDTVANKNLGRLELGAVPDDFGFADPDSVIVLAGKYHPALTPTYTLSSWNATTLKKEWEVPGPDLQDKLTRRLIVSPAGKRFAVTDRQCFAHVYDSATGKKVFEPSGHSTMISWVGFSADSERITTVARDGVLTWTRKGERKSAVSLPELARGRTHPTLFGEHLVWVTRSEDGKKTELVGWDRAKGEIGWRMPVDGDGPDRVLTPDGKRCIGVSWNAEKRVWDVVVYDGPGGKKLHAWTYDKVENGGRDWWWPMAVSTDGETLFIGNDDIVGFDVATGKEKHRIDAGKFKSEHGPAAFPMAVSSDGKRIAVVGGATDERGRGRGYFLRVFEIKTGKELAAHALGDVHNPALRFSPDGKRVAVWNVWGTVIRVCDAESSATEPRKLDGGNSRAWCAAFSPNGANLVVGYQDGTALIWDLSAK